LEVTLAFGTKGAVAEDIGSLCTRILVLTAHCCWDWESSASVVVVECVDGDRMEKTVVENKLNRKGSLQMDAEQVAVVDYC
jgi:hypothetical protein